MSYRRAEEEWMDGLNLTEDNINALSDLVFKAIKKDESGIHLENQQRAGEFNICYQSLKKLFAGQEIKIEAIPHNELPSFGTITLSGKEFVVRNTKALSDIANIASNFDIWVQRDGTVIIDFGFYGMTDKIGG